MGCSFFSFDYSKPLTKLGRLYAIVHLTTPNQEEVPRNYHEGVTIVPNRYFPHCLTDERWRSVFALFAHIPKLTHSNTTRPKPGPAGFLHN